MKRLFRLTVLCLVGLIGQTSIADIKAGTDPSAGILFLVDRSGSMSGLISGIRGAIESTTKSELIAKGPMGLIHFAGCSDEDVVYAHPLAAGNRDQILATVGGLQTNGMTALVKALRMAHSEMKALKHCPQLILFTDYGETCDADMDKTIADLQSYCIEISVITSTTEETVFKKLEKLATKTGGVIRSASGKKEITEQINDILELRAEAVRRGTARLGARKTESKTGEKPDAPADPTAPARAKQPATASQTETKVEPKP